MAKKRILSVDGTDISLITRDSGDFISLTDMARKFEGEAGDHIRNWIRNNATVEFLGAWEKVHNPDFNLVEFHQIKAEYTRNTFIMSAKKWVEMTGAVGLDARAGRYGGTFAHSDIAVQFATWLSPEFHVWLVKEFTRLKHEEAQRLDSGWSLKRQLAKANFYIHSEAVREYLVPIIDWNTRREAIYQASEADLLNLSLFGFTSKEWRTANPDLKGNIRDHASIEQLLIMANLESLNAKLIEWETSRDQRLEILNKTARQQMEILLNTKAIKDTKKLKEKN